MEIISLPEPGIDKKHLEKIKNSIESLIELRILRNYRNIKEIY
jgi:hypothetical protein